jgi:large subunit ribosomal protein L30
MAVKDEVKTVAKRRPGKANSGKTIRVTLLRSPINTRASHRATVRGLGLRRLHHTVELEDTPAVRGMINKVGYLLKLED